jgi:alpha-beta hydrolase superfamily lysophospholipase
MALFEYFPQNYIWNLSLAIAMASGAEIGELMDMCNPLKDAAARGADAGTGDFLNEWLRKAEILSSLAEEDQSRGRALSAAAKLERAALYMLVAERMLSQGDPRRMDTYLRARARFRQAMVLGRANCEPVEVPYLDISLAGLLVRAPDQEVPAPCVLYVNGLDSCKELLYWSKLPQALARRGISTLCIDQPGTGEALRVAHLPATSQSERWATPCFEWLARQPTIDRTRIGITGISLGGHFVPRALAHEPRFASGAVWGANHNWAEVQQQRLKREGENPVPHYWKHVMWVFGAQSMDDFIEKSSGMHLNNTLDRIKVPFLVTHGAHDRQIRLDYAHETFDQLVNSPRRELKVFTEREGGVEHVGADNMSFGRDYIADWFAETLGAHTN